MKISLISIIKIYQKILPGHYGSSLLGSYGGCRFFPSCSEYSIASMEKEGVPKGLLKSCLRVLRCGPWSKGGVDFP